MTKIKKAGPPILVIAVVAGVVGYILGGTQAEQEQSQANANPLETKVLTSAHGGEVSSQVAEASISNTEDQIAQIDNAALATSVVSAAGEPQFDAPYYLLKEKHGARWGNEDKAIEAKLAALQKKHGTKPNVIYILTDDIGYGELGCQGGGRSAGCADATIGPHGTRGPIAEWILLRTILHTDPRCLNDWTSSRSHRSDRRYLSW